MINRVVLVGRLTRNPELRKTTNNTSIASFTIAVDNRMKAADGSKTTSFINCVAWSGLADNVVKFTKKGSLVGVDGRLNQRSYKNQAGNTVQVVEVIAENVEFLGPKSESNSEPSMNEHASMNDGAVDILDEEELPF